MRSVEEQQARVTAAAVAPRPVRLPIAEAQGLMCAEEVVTDPATVYRVPDSLPLWSATDKFNRNKTVIKGQEMGDVNYIKRRYELQSSPIRAGSRLSSQSTPTLLPGWRSRLAAAKKQVSFPFVFKPGVRSSSAGGGSSGRKLDFTRVKPTLLSSARLALRQAQTAANPQLQHRKSGAKASGSGSNSDILSTSQSSLASKPGNVAAKPAATPDASARSTSQGSLASRRSLTSPLPPIPTTSSGAAPTTAKTTTTTAASGAAENDYQAVASKASGKATGQFDPSLHQPTYRYTPPPPRASGRSNRIHSVYDLYATYPRRAAPSASHPSRPPLPCEWRAKKTPTKEPPGGAQKIKTQRTGGRAAQRCGSTSGGWFGSLYLFAPLFSPHFSHVLMRKLLSSRLCALLLFVKKKQHPTKIFGSVQLFSQRNPFFFLHFFLYFLNYFIVRC